MDEAGKRTERRKQQHIDICLHERVESGLSSGFEQYRFRHNALPELDFSDIETSSPFLGKKTRTPFLVSSMTGGTRHAHAINRRLAAAAERRGWAMGLGSGRAALESREVLHTFQVRDVAPDIPLLANIGAVQLNCGYGPEDCERLVDMLEADALVLHLNGLQEIFQDEGDTNFKGLLEKIAKVCNRLPVPVGVKEVGWGIDGRTAMRLLECGVRFIDVAGAGGTSWIQVEKKRSRDPVRQAAAEAFADWGIPTSECIADIRNLDKKCVLVASGGMRSGVDAAKAIALGADRAGFGRSLLADAVDSEETLDRLMERIELELKTAMFGIGAKSLKELQYHDALEKK